MCAGLEHRGPGARGIFHEDRTFLGIQHLRIIDLSTGDQPIYDEDKSVIVVLNGEIYNFKELGYELRERGHSFSTDGDTEVIVHLYEEYGVDCVRHLHRMFAFALWDRRRQQLLIARDRVGKKPLYAVRAEGLRRREEMGPARGHARLAARRHPRRPKQGFTVRMSTWLRGHLRAWSREVLLDRVTLDRGWEHTPEALSAWYRELGFSDIKTTQLTQWGFGVLARRPVKAEAQRPLETRCC